MNARDRLTESQKRIYDELVRECLPRFPDPKPVVAKVVVVGGRVVANATVRVSPHDRNYRSSSEGLVVVRRDSEEIAMRIVRERFGRGGGVGRRQ
jgi:hypothetical protein